MKRFLAFVCILALSPATVFAQSKQGQARLDSLLAEVPKMKEDTNGVGLLEAISGMYYTINPDEGLKWAEKERVLSQKIGWQKGQWKAYNDFGNNYLNKGSYPEALDAFFKSLHIAEELQHKKYTGLSLGNIGNVYLRQKEYPQALAYQFKALKIAEEHGDKMRMQLALGNIGSVYQLQGKTAEALVYQKKALALAEELNNKHGIITQTGNIGSTYGSLKQYPEALAYSFRSLRAAQEVNDKQTIAINLGNIGETYYQIATDSSTALEPDSLVPVSREAALAQAVAFLQKGILACREAQFAEGIPEFADSLSRALERQGHPEQALTTYRESVRLRDSLYNTTNTEAVEKLETQRAIALKDKDILIARLRERSDWVVFIGGGAVLFLVLGILFRGYTRQRYTNHLLSKEKKRSEDLLLNILPAEVAEELKDKGQAVARQFDEVTVLFTDFVDFTSAAEALSPHELVKELHECFSAFDAICEKHGLEKIKTIGDAYMAVCGMPVADPCHAQKAVHAALDILAFMKARRLQERVFKIRIGIHSGPVVAGIVGVKKFAYDIWGDTVNTAARMEQSGEAGKINLSYSTYERIKRDFNCTARGKIAAKHKGEIEMYFVTQS